MRSRRRTSASRPPPPGGSRRPGGLGISKRQSPLVWFLVISGVAFVLRLVHVLQLRQNDPLFFSPQMDALYHHEWALAIAAGKQFIADAYFRAPLYPYLLGLLYRLSGANQLVARIVQTFIGSLGCGFVYLLGRQLLKPQAAGPGPQAGPKAVPDRPSYIVHRPAAVPRVAGLVTAVYPLAIWYDGELLLEGLLAFFIVLGFVLLLRSRETDRRWWLPGIVFGLAAITRPNVLVFLAVLPVWLFLEYRHGAWKRLLQVWGLAALVILPITIRNYAVSRQFVPIAWQAGTNFVIGNNPTSDGVTAVVPGTRADWWGGYNDVKRLAEEAAGRPLKGAEIDRYWLGKGGEFWREQPGSALKLLLRKTFLWFAGFEVGNETDLYAAKRHSFVNFLFFNSRFLKFPFGVLLPLALAGVWLLLRQWRRFLPLYLFVAAYSLSFIVFFVTSRYRTPMVPLVVVPAVVGLVGLIGRMGARKRQRTTALIVAAVAFFLLNANVAGVNRLPSPDQSHFAVALSLHGQNRDAEALAELRRALRYDSATNVLSFEATLLQRSGDSAGAERAARAAVRLHPSDAAAYGTLGYVLATGGRLDSAARYYELAIERDPYSLQAWVNRGNVALNRGRYAEARHYYEGAHKIRPTHAEAVFYLGLCDYKEGKVAEAHAQWRQALELDPSFTRAQQALEQLK